MYAAVQSVQIPGLAGADIAVELQRLILGQHTHGVDAGVGAVGQGEVDNAVLSAKGDGRLGHVAGEHIQPAALTSGQEHCDTFFFIGVSSSLSRYSNAHYSDAEEAFFLEDTRFTVFPSFAEDFGAAFFSVPAFSTATFFR